MALTALLQCLQAASEAGRGFHTCHYGQFRRCGDRRKVLARIHVFNTFFALLTQENSAMLSQRSLTSHGGRSFLIEAFVPDVARFSGGQALELLQ